MPARARTFFALAFLVSVAACRPESGPERPPCVGHLSGAVTGTFTCDAEAIYDPVSDTATVRFDVLTFSGSALDLLLDGTTFGATPAVGTLTELTAGIEAYESVIGGTKEDPIAYFTVRNGSPFPDLGTFTLVLTSAVTATDGAYVVHGTFTAMLVAFPADESAGTVTVDVAF